jgi:hypothetical protein
MSKDKGAYDPRTAQAFDDREWDNRLCGRPTKSGKRCRAYAQMAEDGGTIGCCLHDSRRRTHAQNREDALCKRRAEVT